MVTATTAEITPHRIDIRDNSGLVKQLRGDYTGDDHGISIDSADHALEEAGWVMGTPRWTGTYYKAVVHSEERFRAGRPSPPPRAMDYDDYVKVFGAPARYEARFPGKLPSEAGRYRDEVERIRKGRR